MGVGAPQNLTGGGLSQYMRKHGGGLKTVLKNTYEGIQNQCIELRQV